MNNHPDLYTMMRSIHDSIERDLHRHIMMERSTSGGLSPTIEIVEPDIPFLYTEGPIMEDDDDIRLRNNVMFSHETIRESLFWLKRLVLERYYDKQKRLLLTDIRNRNKPNINTVIWWNHLNNYTKGLKITKWEENNMNNGEPSKMKKYELATENISEPTPRLYNLHIVDAYDVAGAIKEYNDLYIIDDAREQIVVIREREQWEGTGAIISSRVRTKLDRMKHNATDVTKEEEETETFQEEDVEEMKESVVKANTTERTSLEILDHEPIFDIESAGLDKGYAYLLEKTDDDGSVERKVIVIVDISEDRIDYIWRESAHDTIRREGTLTPLGFERDGYKLYPITAEDIK